MLIPLYILVGVWGGAGRVGATLRFVIYTMAGSLLMLVAVISFGLTQGTFDLVDSGTSDSDWIFLGFMAAFVVKAPLFPFHGWLPDAYRESSPEVSAILSGVVSKAAAFGILLIAIPKFPGPHRRLPRRDPRPRLDRAGLRLAARVPGAGHARRGGVLVARAARADHARTVRGERPGLQRRRPADGQPRADLGDALPDRRDRRSAHRDRRVRAASAGWRAAARRSPRCS